MEQSSQTTRNRDNYLFFAAVDNARNISQMLKTVNFKEMALVVITPNGFKVSVTDSKCIQAAAFIQADLFSEFHLKEESLSFQINLNVLLDCLTIFGPSTTSGPHPTLNMFCESPASPLILMLVEGGVVTDCRINTLDPGDNPDFEFPPESVVNKVIMKSEALKDAWNDLDFTSESLEISISPDKPFLRLSTHGLAGTIKIDFSKDADIMECFNCSVSQVNRYKVSLLKPSYRALTQSDKFSLRTDANGFLSLQYLITSDDKNHACFVEYICTPDEDLFAS
ncbi:RAD1 [Cordylochernes scorpioides]|uniref:RAD1 n=1 Tax=Cordylochernes scorpioides TaxID=51811 RepID=A0ABY6L1B4_9ARAC|nr:RAD1 [Cordylochernes scorpioides]